MTKNVHYIPCFWSSLWNNDIYNKTSIQLENNIKRRRKADVYLLSIKSNKVITQKVENIFYEKYLGITVCEGNELLKYKIIESNNIDLNEKYFLSSEEKYTALENSGIYSPINKLVQLNKFESYEDRIHLAAMIVFQYLRTPTHYYSGFPIEKNNETSRLLAILDFNNFFTNIESYYNAVLPLLNHEWHLYSLSEFTFPLSDNPVIIHHNKIGITLTPKHYLEIDMNIKKDYVKYYSTMKDKNFFELRKQTIMNLHSELIFPEKNLLEKIRGWNTWKIRRTYLNKENH